jgi:hypothetical protein
LRSCCQEAEQKNSKDVLHFVLMSAVFFTLSVNPHNIPHIGGKDTQNSLIMVFILRFLSTIGKIGI